MRFGNRRTSDNVESQRGMDPGPSFGGGGGGLGGGAGMLFGVVFSRFGIGGVVVLFIVFALFGGLGSLTGGGGQQALSPQQQQQAAQAGASVCSSDAETRFACQVLASTEDRWTELFQRMGEAYQAPKMVVYDRRGSSGCGAAESAMGPFYCPADHRIYLDTEFFQELRDRFHAPGDFP
jgi:predicted metalloprotease